MLYQKSCLSPSFYLGIGVTLKLFCIHNSPLQEADQDPPFLAPIIFLYCYSGTLAYALSHLFRKDSKRSYSRSSGEFWWNIKCYYCKWLWMTTVM